MTSRLRRLGLPLVVAGGLATFGTAVASMHATAAQLESAATPAPRVAPSLDGTPLSGPDAPPCDRGDGGPPSRPDVTVREM